MPGTDMIRAFRLTALAVLALSLAACSDPNGAQRFLVDQGFHDVHMIGSPWFAGCSKDDYYWDEFRATNPFGQPVHGVVCNSGGWANSSHIRFYDQ